MGKRTFLPKYNGEVSIWAVAYVMIEIFVWCVISWIMRLWTEISVLTVVQCLLSLMAPVIVAGIWIAARKSRWLACGCLIGGALCYIASSLQISHRLALQDFTFLSGVVVFLLAFMKLFPSETMGAGFFDAMDLITPNADERAHNKFSAFFLVTVLCLLWINYAIGLPPDLKQQVLVPSVISTVVNFLLTIVHAFRRRYAT